MEEGRSRPLLTHLWLLLLISTIWLCAVWRLSVTRKQLQLFNNENERHIQFCGFVGICGGIQIQWHRYYKLLKHNCAHCTSAAYQTQVLFALWGKSALWTTSTQRKVCVFCAVNSTDIYIYTYDRRERLWHSVYPNTAKTTKTRCFRNANILLSSSENSNNMKFYNMEN